MKADSKNTDGGWNRTEDLRKFGVSGPDDASKKRMLNKVMADLERPRVVQRSGLVPVFVSAAVLFIVASGLWLLGLPWGQDSREEPTTARHDEAVTQRSEQESAPWVDESGGAVASGTEMTGAVGGPRTLRMFSKSGLRAAAYIHEDGNFEPLSGGESSGRVVAGTVDFEVERVSQHAGVFSITARGVKVSVVGTQFTVNLEGDDVLVTAHQGLVQVQAQRVHLLQTGDQWSLSGIRPSQEGKNARFPGHLYESIHSTGEAVMQAPVPKKGTDEGMPGQKPGSKTAAGRSRASGTAKIGNRGPEKGQEGGGPPVPDEKAKAAPGLEKAKTYEASDAKTGAGTEVRKDVSDKQDDKAFNDDTDERVRDKKEDRAERRRQKTKTQHKDKKQKKEK